MSLPTYPAYADTGKPWLGAVPDHWTLMRLRRCLALNPSRSELAGLPRSLEVTFLPMEAIGEHGELDLSRTRPLWEVEAGYTYLRDGDVVLAKITPCFENGKGALVRDLVNGIGFGTTELIVARADTGRLLPGYLDWVFRSTTFRTQGEAAMYGAGGQKRVPDDFVRELYWAIPSLNEQRAISEFLDGETLKIDSLIAEQEKLLTLLAQKRQATISRAVARGLLPNVQVKSSGGKWLGDVPAHWKMGKIQSFARRESGHTPSRQHPEYWANCTIPWFTLADVWQIRDGRQRYVQDTTEKVSELGIASSSARVLPAGTVILSRTASVGYSAIMACEMATSQDFVNWVCGDSLKPEFLLYVLQGMKPEFDRLMMGSTHQTIYMPDIAKLIMALPPIEEQLKIVEHLNAATSRFDALSDDAVRAVALLRERRAALISAAVTGHIDVRGVARRMDQGERHDPHAHRQGTVARQDLQ